MIDFKLALHTWTIDSTPMDVCLDAAARAGFDAIELRRVDVVHCYERGQTRDEVIRTIADSGIPLGTLGTEYGWFFTEGDEQRRQFDVLRETCAIANAVGCSMIMSAPGQVTGTVAQAIEATKIAGDIVGEAGLRLALEFNSQHPVVNRTTVLQDIVGGAGRASCGLLLDSYHLYRGPGIAKGLAGVGKDELFAFQYSDVPPTPRPARRPVDRLAPGDGTIDWNDLFARLVGIGYDGYLSYEAPNPVFWARSPYDVCADAWRKTRTLLRAADRGDGTAHGAGR